MRPTRHAFPAGAALLAALPIAHLALPACAAGDGDDGGGAARAVVVWERADSGDALPRVWTAAVGEALRAAAADAGAVVCHEGGARSTDPDFLEICAAPPVNPPVLWWKGDVEIRAHGREEIVILTLVLELQPEQAAPELGRRLILLREQVPLPEDVADAERELMLAGRMHEPIRLSEQVRRWFHGLATVAYLEREPPAGDRFAETAPPADEEAGGGETAGPGENAESPAATGEDADSPAAGEDEESPAAAGADSETAGSWTEAERRVLDLMLDGEWAEAVAAADSTLEGEALPPDAAARLRDLRARAEARLDGDGEGGADDPSAAEAAPAQAASGGTAAPPEPFDVTVRVRAANRGEGFVRGADGRLRISEQGIAFVPDDPAAAERWHVGWGELRRAGRAEGLWDVRWPLEIEAAGGTYYVVEIRSGGGFADGGRILAWIAKGRERARGDGGGAVR